MGTDDAAGMGAADAFPVAATPPRNKISNDESELSSCPGFFLVGGAGEAAVVLECDGRQPPPSCDGRPTSCDGLPCSARY